MSWKMTALSHHFTGLVTGVGRTKDPLLRALFQKIPRDLAESQVKGNESWQENSGLVRFDLTSSAVMQGTLSGERFGWWGVGLGWGEAAANIPARLFSL